MSIADDILRTASTLSAPRQGSSFLRLVLVPAAIMAAAIVWQLRWGTIPDTSWIITMVERVLAGDRLYVDILETNPPFTLWLYMPPVAAAQALGISAELAVHAYTYGAVLTGLGLAALILHRSDIAEKASISRHLPAFLALLLIFPGSAFSEREHFGVALVLPLLTLMAWRANPTASARPGLAIAVLAGLAGSVIVLVKPYYALTILVPALMVAWRLRRPFFLFALEYWVIGAVAVGYLALVQLLHPEFLEKVFPLLADSYVLVTTRGSVLLYFAPVLAPLLALIWWLWPRNGASDMARIALAASLASFVPLIYQGKGWAYHAYPAIAFAVIALICLLAVENAPSAGGAADRLRNGRRRPGLALVAACLALSWMPFVWSQRPAAHLVETISEATENPTVALIGSDMAHGHPLTRMVGGRWVSRYCADWLGAFALYLGYLANEGGDKEKAAFYRAMLEDYAAEKKEEFEPRPDIVVFQKKEEFWTAPLLSEFGFSEVLKDYRILAEDKKILIYLRADYSKPDAD